ncbi:MAG: ThuA domain-containing protein [Candidatus Omnitrophica bacterium]|nr:ThuA domain-containing protein [Candidatus Omnitrophota bacterium]
MKKCLMVWGGWDGHQPKETTEIFVPFLSKNGFDVEVSTTLDSFLDSEKMSSLNLIVLCWTMGQITGEQLKGLISAVKNGVGIAGWHGGMGDAFRNDCEYQFMVGGQFVAHPVIGYEVNITDHDDPVTFIHETSSVPDSEQYYMHVDPSNKVLATTIVKGTEDVSWIKGCIMPVVWKKMYGKGRVFYSSIGHQVKDFDIPEVKEIVQRGMLWAAK